MAVLRAVTWTISVQIPQSRIRMCFVSRIEVLFSHIECAVSHMKKDKCMHGPVSLISHTMNLLGCSYKPQLHVLLFFSHSYLVSWHNYPQFSSAAPKPSIFHFERASVPNVNVSLGFAPTQSTSQVHLPPLVPIFKMSRGGFRGGRGGGDRGGRGGSFGGGGFRGE